MSKTETEQSRAIQSVGNLYDFSNMEKALELCKMIAKSGMSPLTKENDVLVAMLYGDELGVGRMSAINNIYVVDGKAAIGFHIANSLLLKAGISYEIEKDCQPVINYIDVETKETYTIDELREIKKNLGLNYQVVVFKGTKEEKAEQLKSYKEKFGTDCILVVKHVTGDFESTVHFERLIKRVDGTIKTMNLTVNYKLSQVPEKKRSNQNWANHTSQMLTNRAILIGGRRIAGDILNGMYETTELLDFNDVPYNYDDENGVIEIKDKEGNVVRTVDTKDIEAEVIQDELEDKETVNTNETKSE